MSYPLNNVTTADAYTTANTLNCPGSVRLNIDVTNAAVYYQLGTLVGGVNWDAETFMTPSFRGLDRKFDAIRVRSAKAGAPAQVTLLGLAAGEVS